MAVDAIKAASHPHHFLSVTKGGHSAIVSTLGNEDCHIILCGGPQPNYDAQSVEQASQKMQAAGLRPAIMIDSSHSNSNKDYRRQPEVLADVGAQISGGDDRIIGVMIESHLVAGRQDLVDRSEEHTLNSSHVAISYAVFCLKKKRTARGVR